MSDFVGASVDGLRTVGRESQRSAKRLRDIGVELAGLVKTTGWRGPDAAQFEVEWNSYRARLETVAAALDNVATQLGKHADEQEQASSAGSGGSRSQRPFNPERDVLLPKYLGGFVNIGSLALFYRILSEIEHGHRIPRPIAERFPAMEWAVDTGKAELLALRGASDEEQAAWWAGLTQDQREALVFAYPGLLAGMAGLPTEVRQAAHEQFAISKLGETAVRVESDSISGNVKLGVIDLGAEGTATLTQMADGTYRVELDLTGSIGREFESGAANAGVGVEGGASSIYHFEDEETARWFLEQAKADPLSAIEAFKSQRIATTATLAITGDTSVDLGGAEVSVSGSAGGEYNFDSGERTLFVDVDASGSVAGSSGSLDGRVELVLNDNNQVVGASFSGTMGVDAGVGVEAILSDISGEKLAGASSAVSVGGDVRFEASIDPSDPVVQGYLKDLVANPGDTAAIRGLMQHSEATIAVDSTTEVKDGGNYLVVDYERSSSTSVNQSTFVKPPGGNWVQVTRG